MKIPLPLLDQIRQALTRKSHIAALTGAGISAESGIPTFREAQTGLWAQYDPMELATPSAFQRNPKLVWEWYAWRRALVAKARPNPGHTALAALEGKADHFTLLTQNVDNLHQDAGSMNVVELHGNIMRTRCSAENTVVASWDKNVVPPRCPTCGGLLRPDVVWFNENLPARALQLALQAAQKAVIFFSIGTSSLVQPAASLPLFARENLATIIEINPEPTPLSELAHFSIRGPAGPVLQEIIKQL